LQLLNNKIIVKIMF